VGVAVVLRGAAGEVELDRLAGDRRVQDQLEVAGLGLDDVASLADAVAEGRDRGAGAALAGPGSTTTGCGRWLSWMRHLPPGCIGVSSYPRTGCCCASTALRGATIEEEPTNIPAVPATTNTETPARRIDSLMTNLQLAGIRDVLGVNRRCAHGALVTNHRGH